MPRQLGGEHRRLELTGEGARGHTLNRAAAAAQQRESLRKRIANKGSTPGRPAPGPDNDLRKASFRLAIPQRAACAFSRLAVGRTTRAMTVAWVARVKRAGRTEGADFTPLFAGR